MTTPTPATPSEFEPCPFCDNGTLSIATLRNHFCVQCTCEASGPWRLTPDGAVIAWNCRASRLAAPPQGFALVPVEPTPQMIRAGSEATRLEFNIANCYRKMYTAMLAAAPAPQGPTGGGE